MSGIVMPDECTEMSYLDAEMDGGSDNYKDLSDDKSRSERPSV